MARFANWQDLVFPVGIISSVLVILVPLPTWLLDVLLAGNITLAVIVLLTTVFVKTPLEFSVFPSLLLAATLARLVLNVASTRLILTEPTAMAAGGIIRSFSDFVTGDQIVVGLIIFIIIVVIQFVVITKGATRISEVAARFALDGMPGRQMAIDADLNAGIIDDKEAQRRRSEITQQADFYGAMDGASKFVRGDAVAGIIITLINVVGGLVIGVFEQGMGIAQAAEIFTKLTIGDGLVSQVPAFLISLAAALLVTRSTQKANMPAELLMQIFARPQALAIAGAFLGVLVFTNLPTMPLLTIGAGCAGMAFMMKRQAKQDAAAATAVAEEEAAPPPQTAQEQLAEFLVVDPMELDLGVDLVKVADPKRGGDLLERITGVRHNVAADIGILLPKVRIRSDMQLGQFNYRVSIANNGVAGGELYPDKLMAMDSGETEGEIPGIRVKDPAFHQDAVWIDAGLQDRAEMLGYTVAEPAAVLATHLQEIVRQHADELLTRDATQELVEELKKTAPAVVEELIPGVLKLGEVQQVLQMLLREQVSIRQLGLILETIGDHAGRTKDPIWLTEYVRHRLSRTLCSRYTDDDNRIHVVTVDHALEDRIAAGIEHTERGLFIRMSPQAVQATCDLIAEETAKLIRMDKPPVVLVSPQIRPGLKQMTSANLPRLAVLSYSEIARDVKVESIGYVADKV